MIQMESKIEVADNTGARVAKMIGVIGKRTRSARVGDVITAIDDETVDSPDALGTVIAKRRPDDAVTVTVLRDGEPLELPATLGVRDGSL